MAIVKTGNRGQKDPNYEEFQISDVSELLNLPKTDTVPRCSVGSLALLESTTEFKVFILSTGNEWIEFV